MRLYLVVENDRIRPLCIFCGYSFRNGPIIKQHMLNDHCSEMEEVRGKLRREELRDTNPLVVWMASILFDSEKVMPGEESDTFERSKDETARDANHNSVGANEPSPAILSGKETETERTNSSDLLVELCEVPVLDAALTAKDARTGEFAQNKITVDEEVAIARKTPTSDSDIEQQSDPPQLTLDTRTETTLSAASNESNPDDGLFEPPARCTRSSTKKRALSNEPNAPIAEIPLPDEANKTNNNNRPTSPGLPSPVASESGSPPKQKLEERIRKLDLGNKSSSTMPEQSNAAAGPADRTSSNAGSSSLTDRQPPTPQHSKLSDDVSSARPNVHSLSSFRIPKRTPPLTAQPMSSNMGKSVPQNESRSEQSQNRHASTDRREQPHPAAHSSDGRRRERSRSRDRSGRRPSPSRGGSSWRHGRDRSRDRYSPPARYRDRNRSPSYRGSGGNWRSSRDSHNEHRRPISPPAWRRSSNDTLPRSYCSRERRCSRDRSRSRDRERYASREMSPSRNRGSAGGGDERKSTKEEANDPNKSSDSEKRDNGVGDVPEKGKSSGPGGGKWLPVSRTTQKPGDSVSIISAVRTDAMKAAETTSSIGSTSGDLKDKPQQIPLPAASNDKGKDPAPPIDEDDEDDLRSTDGQMDDSGPVNDRQSERSESTASNSDDGDDSSSEADSSSSSSSSASDAEEGSTASEHPSTMTSQSSTVTAVFTAAGLEEEAGCDIVMQTVEEDGAQTKENDEHANTVGVPVMDLPNGSSESAASVVNDIVPPMPVILAAIESTPGFAIVHELPVHLLANESAETIDMPSSSEINGTVAGSMNTKTQPGKNVAIVAGAKSDCDGDRRESIGSHGPKPNTRSRQPSHTQSDGGRIASVSTLANRSASPTSSRDNSLNWPIYGRTTRLQRRALLGVGNEIQQVELASSGRGIPSVTFLPLTRPNDIDAGKNAMPATTANGNSTPERPAQFQLAPTAKQAEWSVVNRSADVNPMESVSDGNEHRGNNGIDQLLHQEDGHIVHENAHSNNALAENKTPTSMVPNDPDATALIPILRPKRRRGPNWSNKRRSRPTQSKPRLPPSDNNESIAVPPALDQPSADEEAEQSDGSVTTAAVNVNPPNSADVEVVYTTQSGRPVKRPIKKEIAYDELSAVRRRNSSGVRTSTRTNNTPVPAVTSMEASDSHARHCSFGKKPTETIGNGRGETSTTDYDHHDEEGEPAAKRSKHSHPVTGSNEANGTSTPASSTGAALGAKKCTKCKIMVPHSEQLDHLVKEHLKKSLFLCPYCPFQSAADFLAVDLHIRNQHAANAYAWPIDNMEKFREVLFCWQDFCFGENGQ